MNVAKWISLVFGFVLVVIGVVEIMFGIFKRTSSFESAWEKLTEYSKEYFDDYDDMKVECG